MSSKSAKSDPHSGHFVNAGRQLCGKGTGMEASVVVHVAQGTPPLPMAMVNNKRRRALSYIIINRTAGSKIASELNSSKR